MSDSTDPWFNLSYEDWSVPRLRTHGTFTDPRRLLRNTLHNEPTLFIYRNTPCVVIGRNQVSWLALFERTS